jgi:ring-1,2-phenylacetyl-CoA epoxidase subunit PaaE
VTSAVTSTPAARSRTAFYPLTVARVEPLPADSAAITLAVPVDLVRDFAFAPGQFLTVRHAGERRSYSICAPAGTPPRIGVRAVPGGAVSGWLVHRARPGDRIEAQLPQGGFTPDLSVPADHVLIGAGSGITPLLSIAASVLAADATSTVTLLYGNRRGDTVMFADDLADLKDAHPARLSVTHVLSREPQEVELHSGRLDAGRLAALLPAVAPDLAGVAHWWLCGPYGLITGATRLLRGLGVPASRLHRELFWVGDDPPAPAVPAVAPAGAAVPAQAAPADAPAPGATVTVVLDGRATTLSVPPGTPVLDGARRVRPDLPYACKGGVCGTCRARLTEGAATMRRNFALEPEETAAGYILTCQAIPETPTLTVSYDG